MRTDAGHRKRMKDRFRKEGLDNFDEVHALELLLFYGVPRQDTKPIARRLLDHFGSFSKVLEAAPETLMQVEGVGEGISTFLNLINDTMRYYLVNREQAPEIFNDLNDCGKYLVNLFHGKREEEVWVLCLDGKKKLLSCQKISEGGLDSVSVSTRKVVEVALTVNAASVILAHNHPHGLALPSNADKLVTIQLRRNLEALGLALADHMIVGENDYTSLRQSNYCPWDD